MQNVRWAVTRMDWQLPVITAEPLWKKKRPDTLRRGGSSDGENRTEVVFFTGLEPGNLSQSQQKLLTELSASLDLT